MDAADCSPYHPPVVVDLHLTACEGWIWGGETARGKAVSGRVRAQHEITVCATRLCPAGAWKPVRFLDGGRGGALIVPFCNRIGAPMSESVV